MSILSNSRHELFARQVANGVPQNEAFVVAGYSEKSADAGAARLVKKSEVAARISELRVRSAEDARVDAAFVLARLVEQTNADILDIQDSNGNFKPVSEWPLVWRRMIQGLEIERKSVRSTDGVQAGESKSWDKTEDTIIKVKFIDRLKNLELLGRHKAIDAFVQQVKGAELHLHLHQKVENKLNRARLVAAGTVVDIKERTVVDH